MKINGYIRVFIIFNCYFFFSKKKNKSFKYIGVHDPLKDQTQTVSLLFLSQY